MKTLLPLLVIGCLGLTACNQSGPLFRMGAGRLYRPGDNVYSQRFDSAAVYDGFVVIKGTTPADEEYLELYPMQSIGKLTPE